MPIYEYVCPNCESKFEALRPMSDGREARCPDCGTESPRVLSVFAAFSKSSEGQAVPVAGGGCACAAGGSCGCGGF
ncbi:MAG: zinc ribbon domain-containing protein [Chloroflexi bacterium]|nr:zinc ribbon domain-containing protein [Chloroflexota bacterium]